MDTACGIACAPANWRLGGQCDLGKWDGFYCRCGDGRAYSVAVDGNVVTTVAMDGNSIGGLQ